MSNEKRSYVKRERAASQEKTRRRIAAATAELHAEVGPARTTIAEIAKRAGVQRPTVYNNFPREYELFAACQAHFLESNPPPDFARVFRRPDGERVERALRELYGWWRRSGAMSRNVARDRGTMPALDELMRDTADAQFAALADALAGGAGKAGRAMLAVAMQYATWATLSEAGMSDAAAARTMARAVEASR